MSGCTGSLAALGEKDRGISRKDRERRGDSSRDCSEVHLIIKIIGRGEFFYDVVIQNWNAAERSLTSSYSSTSLQRDVDPARIFPLFFVTIASA